MKTARDRLRSMSTNPLNLLCLGLALIWLAMALFARPIGDYGVETDFYGDARYAKEWRSGQASVMNGYRGPGYHLVLGPLGWIFGDLFLAGKLLSVFGAALGLRLLGGLLGSLWGRAVALTGVLFVAATPVFLHHTFRACTDPFFWFLFVAVLVLLFREEGSPVRNWGEAGAVAGLAWLVRYNGGVLGPIAIVVAVMTIRPWGTAIRALGTFAAAAFLVAGPWMAFLWSETGNPLWNQTYQLVAANIYGLEPGLAEQGRLKTYVGFQSLAEVIAVDPPLVVRSFLRGLLDHFRFDVTRLVGIPLAVVAALGMVLSGRTWLSRRTLAFAAAGVLTFLSLVPAFYNPRFMIPLLVWWAAAGAGVGRFAFRRDFDTSRRRRAALFTTVVAGFLAAVVYSNQAEIRQSLDPRSSKVPPYEILGLGKRVKELDIPLGPDTPIAARKPQIGYELGAPVVSIPFGDLRDLKESGARYLLISRSELATFPNLMSFVTNPTQTPAGLRYLASYRGKIDDVEQFAAFYEVEGEKSDAGGDAEDSAPASASIEGLSRVDELRVRLARWYKIWAPTRSIGELLGRIDPAAQDHLEVLLLRGDDAWMNGKPADAYREIQKATTLYPDAIRARYRKAGLRLLEGEGVRPRSLLGDVAIPARVDTASWWEGQGDALMGDGEFTAAVAPYLVSMDFAPRRARLYRRLGDALLRGRRLEDALAAYEAYPSEAPPDLEMEQTMKALREVIARKAD